MVRSIASRSLGDDLIYHEFSGLSTDTKPTGTDIATGSTFVEVDTGDVYFFDEESNTWLKVGGSNG